MAKKKKNLSPKHQPWVDARKRFHLSHAHVQMARELGMNPKKLGGKANHKQEPWKIPLPEFIEHLYFKRFGKTRPDNVRSIEQMVQDKKRKRAERQARKQQEMDSQETDASDSEKEAAFLSKRLIDDSIPKKGIVRMEETNSLLGEEMKKVVRNQIKQNNPPETKQAYDRLIKDGYPKDEVIRQLAVVVASEIFDVMKNKEPYNQERYIKRLNDLPKEPE